MRRLLIVLTVAVACVLAAACGEDDAPVTAGDDDPSGSSTTHPPADPPTEEPADEPGDEPAEEPIEYRSVSVTENGEPRPLVEGTEIALRLGPDTIGASLGCNSMSGDYRLEDGILVVGSLAMTEMGCPEPRMEQDRWFAELLTSRPTLTLQGDTLVIADDTTRVTLRERSVVDPDRALEGTDWSVTGFIDGDVAMSSDPGAGRAPGRLRFDPATSTAGGSDGCNGFSVPYEMDGTKVRFGEITAHLAGCEGGEEYRRRFHAVLRGTVDWEITADRLTLTTPDGTGVTYRAAE